MEEVSAQIASPIFLHQHQPFTGRFREPHHHPVAKKRSLPFAHSPQFHKPLDSWNPKQWEWDATRFIAKPLETDVLRLGTAEPQQLPTTRDHSNSNTPNFSKSIPVDDDADHLRLKLGAIGKGTSFASQEEPVSRPNKRVRSGSPGTATYPMCQVDDCKEDLSHAKDYHRRHKVCSLHSKATNALVAKQMQRFCQQCSRFHPLTEFDEGKRSCRRRLAGHNRRRRKTVPEDTTSRLLLPGNRESTANSDLDIVNLLAVLTRAQGNTEEKFSNVLTTPDKDQLLQILAKINSLPLPGNLASKLPILGSLNRNTSSQIPSENRSQLNGSAHPSTMDLLAALSTTPATITPKTLDVQAERSSLGSDSEKTNSSCSNQATCLNLQNAPSLEFPCVGTERSSSSQQSPVDDSDGHIEGMHPNLPLQLFSSSPEDNSPPKLPASRKYFSSGSSNPSNDRSPSSSPPVVQKLFPVQSLSKTPKSGSTSNSGEGVVNSRAIDQFGCNTSLQLFGNSTVGTDVASVQNFPYHAGYTSSGSDHSPSSLNSDPQDRTGRISFKLFDKEPSHLPGTLRTQIYNWLLNCPSEMESYIKPGCVVLSVYLLMPSSSWQQFEKKLLRFCKSLTKDFDTDFWSNGRFLVCTGKQLALHVDGKVRLFKSRRAWSSPELVSVSPLAVVGGQETSVLLRGRNLIMSGTKISCSHTDDFTSREVSVSGTFEDSEYDEISLCNFKVTSTSSSFLGRCFIEVENGLRGATFPIIIADKAICQELRLLEDDISVREKTEEEVLADRHQDTERPRSREEILHFLNELGWLFQRKCKSSLTESPNYKICRFKFLLIFSVEHDFCALVKSLLDILVEINLSRKGMETESLELLSEIHLLNRAVKRRCKKMIDLLINYAVDDASNTSKQYIFLPNLVGPGGITPLHLAACSSRLDDIVDSLTSDPQEIGLQCWNSLLDANGMSPYAYAEMRNNLSYNRLVAQKLTDKRNGQISVSIGNEIEPLRVEMNQQIGPGNCLKLYQGSCSKCATAALRYNSRNPVSQRLLHRPYIHSMLAIAAVCVCVCLFLRGAPDIGLVAPFKWENLNYGSI